MSPPFDPTKLDLDMNKDLDKKVNFPLSDRKNEVISKQIEQDDILKNITIEGNQNTKPIAPEFREREKQAKIIIEDKDRGKAKKAIEEKKLIDINIESLEGVIELIDEKEYDYVLIEPEESQVKITFRQDNIDKSIKYVKFPVYTNILFKIKQTAGLVIDITGEEQEGKGNLHVGTKKFKIATKTAPGQNGERIWIQAKEDTSQKGKKQVKKTSISMILGFLGAILFVSLILGGAFIAFIVVNAKTIEDVKFFASLGINLNDINTFISQVVSFIFSILLMISTLALSFGLFKFFLTKKIYKQKKISYGILSAFLLIITFVVGSSWMIIDQKIKNLPNWQEQAYGDLKIFDNDLLISGNFEENQALISETQNLIGPVTLKFDLTNFQNNQSKKGISVKKYIWDFEGEIIETFTPTVTKVFDKKQNYEISVTSIGEDLKGEQVEQDLSNIPAVSISNLIKIQETLTNNGGKRLSFNAENLSNLGKIEWYFKEPLTKENPSPDYPEWKKIDEGYIFIPGKIFFDEIFVGVSIVSGSSQNSNIDKVIVISPNKESEISGDISFQQDLENELMFTFYVENPSTNFSNGFIESYNWTIEGKTYTKKGNFNITESSPEIEHNFKVFGDHNIEVVLTDSKGKTKTITKTITIAKNIELRTPLLISDKNGIELDNIRYEKKSHEYYINALGVPSILKLDARYVRPMNILYSLQDVSWDIGGNGDIDARGKSFNYTIPTEGNHILVATYHFVHRKNPNDTIDLEESIYIEAIKKEAILNLKIEKKSNYAPVSVRFDASKSFIKNDDIIKFIYDYGDGEVPEERDAINPGHIYSESGNYTIKLTVVGSSGKSYSIEKKLILLPPPQEVKITTSLKKAPIGQGIDFSSAKSEGQIVEYFWDFGDGNVSTQANPTHSYNQSGTFKVELKVNFSNNNSIIDTTEIKIFKEE